MPCRLSIYKATSQVKAFRMISRVAQSLLTLHPCCCQSCSRRSEAALLRQHMSPLVTPEAPQAMVTKIASARDRKRSSGLYLWRCVKCALHQTCRSLLCSPTCLFLSDASADTWLSALQSWASAGLSCTTDGDIISILTIFIGESLLASPGSRAARSPTVCMTEALRDARMIES